MQDRQDDSRPLVGCGTILLGALLSLVFFRRRQTAATTTAPALAVPPSTALATPTGARGLTAETPAERAPAQDVAPKPQKVRPGWHAVPPEPLPHPTYWPAVLALGVVFLLWGFVTSYIITGVGLILFIIALRGWIQELQHEQ